MPTLLRWRGWLFLFYSADGHEPPHIHVRKGRQEVKFWLNPNCDVAAVRRATDRQINALQRVVIEHREDFLRKWHDYFGA